MSSAKKLRRKSTSLQPLDLSGEDFLTEFELEGVTFKFEKHKFCPEEVKELLEGEFEHPKLLGRWSEVYVEMLSLIHI